MVGPSVLCKTEIAFISNLIALNMFLDVAFFRAFQLPLFVKISLVIICLMVAIYLSILFTEQIQRITCLCPSIDTKMTFYSAFHIFY